MKKIYIVLLVVLTTNILSYSQTNNWDKRFSNPGADWFVKDMEYFNGKLYYTIGSKIQTWNDTTIQNFGTAVNGEIYELSFIDNELYIGGSFYNMPDPKANYWAKYNSQTNQWEGIDGTLNQPVYAIAKFDNNRIALGGAFTEIPVQNYLPKSNFILWNTQANKWDSERIDTVIQLFGGSQNYTGISGTIYHLQTIYNGNDIGGIAIGGSFSVSKNWMEDPYLNEWAHDIAVWNHSQNAGNNYGTWTPIENRDTVIGFEYPQIGGEVHSITQIPSGDYAGKMLVGGHFHDDANLNVYNLAICDTNMIIPLENEENIRINGIVYTTAITPNYFYIGGFFTTTGNFTAVNIVRFNRTTHQYEPLYFENSQQNIPLNNDVKKIIAVNDSTIYISGLFNNAGGIVHADYLVKYDGKKLISLGLGLEAEENNSGSVTGIEKFGNNIFVAGNFLDAGSNLNVDNFAIWNGNEWQAAGNNAINGTVNLMYKDDTGLILIGDFENAGGIEEADRIVRWTGSSFESIGVNSGFAQNIDIKSIIKYNNSYIIGGNFTQINGQSISYLARYNGNGWEQFGTPLNYYVTQLSVYDNELYISGAFSDVNNNENIDCIAKWNGTSWQSVTGYFNDNESPVVYSFYKDNSDIYVSGRFSDLGNNTNADNIALWSTNTWQSLGQGFSWGWANKITKYNGILIAGGFFRPSETNPNANFIAQFNGSSWIPMVEPSFYDNDNSEIKDFEIIDQKLYVGGYFSKMNDGNTYSSKFGIYDLSNLPFLMASTDTVFFDYTANNQDINITSNINWTASCNQNWVIINPTSGSGNGTVNISVTENQNSEPRTTTLTISGSNFTKIITITQADFITSINEIPQTELVIYPNPATDFVEFTVNSSTNIESIKIFNLYGQLIEIINNPTNNKIDLTNISKGVYYIRIDTAKDFYIGKIIKQ